MCDSGLGRPDAGATATHLRVRRDREAPHRPRREDANSGGPPTGIHDEEHMLRIDGEVLQRADTVGIEARGDDSVGLGLGRYGVAHASNL